MGVRTGADVVYQELDAATTEAHALIASVDHEPPEKVVVGLARIWGHGVQRPRAPHLGT